MAKRRASILIVHAPAVTRMATPGLCAFTPAKLECHGVTTR